MAARWLFPTAFTVQFRHFAGKVQEFGNMYKYNCVSTFEVCSFFIVELRSVLGDFSLKK